MSKKLFIYGISLTVLGEVLYIVKEILQARRAISGSSPRAF